MQLPTTEYAPFYNNYIQLAGAVVRRTDLLLILQQSQEKMQQELASCDDSLLDYRYASEKWTVNEVIQHLLDCEVIFLARALHIARQPGSELPGFDENVFQTNLHHTKTTFKSLLETMQLQRQLTMAVLHRISDAQLTSTGKANGHVVSVRALFNMIAGHQLHHVQILKTRYNLTAPAY
jgi:uncharacterized damage-inducible protein DinB